MVMFLTFIVSILYAEKSLLSYVDIDFMQSANISKDALYFTGMINSAISISYELNSKNLVNLSYLITYTGAGLWDLERDLKERNIKYSFIVEDHFSINDGVRIRPQLYIGRERFKESATSSYDENIYNNNIKGIGVSVDLVKEYKLTSYLNYRKVKYPNYTDLLSEIRYDNYYTRTGMYDKDVYDLGLRLKKGSWFYETSYIAYNYLNQKVIGPTGTYLDKKQRDKKLSFLVGYDYRFDELFLYPSFKLNIYLSNQNYIRYKSLFDTSPYFVSDAYSYKEYGFKIPIKLPKERYEINGEIRFVRRGYFSRPPRDSNNEFKTFKRQHQNVLSISGEYRRSIAEIAYYTIGYILMVSNSNNKFEFYIPYNYTNHIFYLGYGIKY